VSPDPVVVTPRILQSLDAAVRAIPTTARGRAEAVITPLGVSVQAAYRPRPWLDLSGFALREWRGSFDAGFRIGSTW